METPQAESSGVSITITPPRLLTTAAVLWLNAYGFILVLPVVIAFLVISALTLGVITFLLPLLGALLTLFFLPTGFGNPYVRRLVRRLPSPPDAGQATVPVQLTLWPRLRSGMRAGLEDADDIGWLTVREGALSFSGDAVQLRIPLAQVQEVQSENSGWRGLFLYGPRVAVVIKGVPQAQVLYFAERSSWVLTQSWKNARALHALLQKPT